MSFYKAFTKGKLLIDFFCHWNTQENATDFQSLSYTCMTQIEWLMSLMDVDWSDV